MYESLGQTAKGLSKSTILRAIKSHWITATRSKRNGDWTIEPAELHRVSLPAPASNNEGGAGKGAVEKDAVTPDAMAAATAATAVLEAQVAGLRETADLLRRQLDDMSAERDHWRDQARRPWWRRLAGCG
jgi:hypothetical protein